MGKSPSENTEKKKKIMGSRVRVVVGDNTHFEDDEEDIVLGEDIKLIVSSEDAKDAEIIGKEIQVQVGARAQGCYCKKCGALVDPMDEKCPNGHVLAEVGRRFVRSAPAGIVFNASEAAIKMIKDIKDNFETLSKEELEEKFNEINENLRILRDQTSPKTLWIKIICFLIENIAGVFIGMIIFYLISLLFS